MLVMKLHVRATLKANAHRERWLYFFGFGEIKELSVSFIPHLPFKI
jgi:hypothetical protein